MAGMGAGYDLSVSTFSPDGRIFQVEYATKAVDSSTTAIARTFNNGVIFAVEKYVASKMSLNNPTRVFPLDKHIGCCIAGFLADGSQLIQRARVEAINYRKVYGEPIPVRMLADRLAMFVHAFTLYGSLRPLGASIIIGGIDKGKKPELYCIEPSGTCYKYSAMAIGKGRQLAKTELERISQNELSPKEALFESARILRQSHDENDDKSMEVELAWIAPESNGIFAIVPTDLKNDISSMVNSHFEELERAD